MRLSQEGSLRCDAWALEQLQRYENGKLIMWSWISRGHVTLEEMAAWHFNNDIKEAEAAMSRLKKGMAHLYSLDSDITHDRQQKDSEVHDADADAPLEGETATFWAIQAFNNEKADPVPLPSWFQLPIDNLILTWKKENEIWNKRFEKRLEQGKDQLAPKQNAAHEAWKKTQERILVLDKKKEATVKNPEKKKLTNLKKTCLALVIHPSDDPCDLWIKAGTGQKWALKLLRGSVLNDAPIPEGMDHFAGVGYKRNCCTCMQIC